MTAARRRLDHRIGLNVPYEWWPGAATLKAIEAAGFRWVQVAAPPVEMLADPRHGVRHATALRRSLEVTELCAVVHGPTSLKLGNALHDRAFEGLLEYAQQIDADYVVYHALDFPRRGSRQRRRREGAASPRRVGGGDADHDLRREPLPGLPGPLQRLPRPAVGSRPAPAGRQPGGAACCSTSGTRTWSPATWASRCSTLVEPVLGSVQALPRARQLRSAPARREGRPVGRSPAARPAPAARRWDRAVDRAQADAARARCARW